MESQQYTLSQILEWYKKQAQEWPAARKGIEGLDQVVSRTIKASGLEYTLQFNPSRAVSTLAKVDKASIQKRACFLCEANRDKEQESLPYLGRYEILVNPFPCFLYHLTVPSNKHEWQCIKGRILDMCKLSVLCQGYTVFYNGARCGASAPDHMHMQAVPNNLLQRPKDDLLEIVIDDSGIHMEIEKTIRHGIFITSKSAQEIETLLEATIASLPPHEQEEPLFNLLMRYEMDTWQVLLIPRTQHRPTCYFKEGDEQILVSPASIDMAGTIVLPRKEDYDKMTTELLEDVLRDICLSDEQINEVKSGIKARYKA